MEFIRSFLSTYCWLVVAMQLMTPTNGNSVISCKKEGRYPYPNDCGRYIDCIPSSTEGQFSVREGHCHGFPYSPSLRRCVSNEEKPGCTMSPSRARRSVSFPDPDFDFLCPDDNSKLGCHNCKVKYECISGKAYIEYCPTGSTCSNILAFGGGACLPYSYTSQGDTCKCEQLGVTADTYSQEYFIFCDTSSDPPKITELKCNEGETFDDTMKDCMEKPPTPCNQEPAIPECGDKIETRVNPNNCAWAYTCLPNGNISTCCGDDKYFDEDSSTCIAICDIDTTAAPSQPVCDKAGKVADKEDCTKYHLCLGSGDDKLHETVICPEGTYFKETACVGGSLPEGCITNTFSYAECPGFEEANANC